ncbi:MAG: phosphatase PAP2 family protein [Desulfuromonadales bacterium]
MRIRTILRLCPVICTITAVSTVLLLKVATAEESNNAKSSQLINETTTKSLPLPHSYQEAVRVTPNGTFYKIDDYSYAYYEKPKAYSFLVNAPFNIVDWLKDSFQQKNTLTIAGLAVATAGLIAVDQDLYRVSHDAGRSLNITSDDRMKGKISLIPGYPIQYPTNVGSALYFLGDGVIPISITAGMFSYGLATSDVRSLQTSSQLAEGLISVGIVVQALKRTAGRQTPGRATEPGGKWRPFPGFNEYNNHTPSYDAFPSGHLAAAMMTITVLADNYPEYPLIRPIGYGAMTLIGFQMINNGVHWASDYPIAIAIGYGLGKVAVSHGRKVVSSENHQEKTTKRSLFRDFVILPMPIEKGGAIFMVAKF